MNTLLKATIRQNQVISLKIFRLTLNFGYFFNNKMEIKKMNIKEILKTLKKQKIKTWFDLGLYIDEFKEDLGSVSLYNKKDVKFKDFKKNISSNKIKNKGGIGFITFYYSVDGVTMEIVKYAKVMSEIFGGKTPIHFISGAIHENGKELLDKKYNIKTIDEINGFDDWKLYNKFFHTKLERGSEDYNKLVIDFWEDTLNIIEKLGSYIEENDLKLLYLINTNSNPGNVSLALALVFISEFMQIPVISNNHDYYFEDGNSEVDILHNGKHKGPRDHFFTNFHLGEVFSIIEMIYQWNSRLWFCLNINIGQANYMMNRQGYNPASTGVIGTAIDTSEYKLANDFRQVEIIKQIRDIFTGKENEKENKTNPILVTGIESFNNTYNPKTQDTELLKPVLLGATNNYKYSINKENIFFLQPTRIIRRKQIEINLEMITKLFKNEKFYSKFDTNKYLTITLLITGPISGGQSSYFKELLVIIESLFTDGTLLKEKYRNRLFIGLMFSEFDKPHFIEKHKNPIKISDLYSLTDLVTLPSQTEGRGLPIIEASYCKTPIFTNRYFPESVFVDVIGEKLEYDRQIKVIDFKYPDLNDNIINRVIVSLFSRDKSIPEHNRAVIEKRYSFEAFKIDMERILYRFYLHLGANNDILKKSSFQLKQYLERKEIVKKTYLQKLVNTENRQYLPGCGQIKFMIMLKSLIDPSYFRVEEKVTRGRVMKFARQLLKNPNYRALITREMVSEFYNIIENLFFVTGKDLEIQIDHSLAYRHRNKKNFLYREFTIQEITSIVHYLFREYFIAITKEEIEFLSSKNEDTFSFNRLNLSDENFSFSDIIYTSIFESKDKNVFEIDHIDKLRSRLLSDKPYLILLEDKFITELDLFVLYPIKRIIANHYDKKIEEINKTFLIRAIEDNVVTKRKIKIIIQKYSAINEKTAAEIVNYIVEDVELNLLFESDIIDIIPSEHFSNGLNLYEIGEQLANEISNTEEKNGFLISFGDQNTIITDIISIERFNIGRVKDKTVARMMGIKVKDKYIQWVPSGLRFCLAYPTPVQNGKEFSEQLKSDLFIKLCKQYGEQFVLNKLKEDAITSGSKIEYILNTLAIKNDSDDFKENNEMIKELTYNSVNGIYKDGLPWAGSIAKLNIKNSEKEWLFTALSASNGTKTVLNFIDEFENNSSKINNKVALAWNGGYILNPELVGKLGIPETFIGSPLGLIISNGKTLSIPLFNKPAFLVKKDGSLDIERVSVKNGFEIILNDNKSKLSFTNECYNRELVEETLDLQFYDLLYSSKKITAKDRVIVRLAGNRVKDIIITNKKEVDILPVGITLSFKKEIFDGIKNLITIGNELSISLKGFENIVSAIEAGPLLLMDNKNCIDMDIEGWKTENSIATQAARLDYLDMRGPKIAIGLDDKGNLIVLTINGRIRESVGATHIDMAEILKEMGVVKAMGFDPGGSSTLVADGKVLNISPYNSLYERDVYSLKPEPRAVANAVVVSYEI